MHKKSGRLYDLFSLRSREGGIDEREPLEAKEELTAGVSHEERRNRIQSAKGKI
jgi:hypothetical protein